MTVGIGELPVVAVPAGGHIFPIRTRVRIPNPIITIIKATFLLSDISGIGLFIHIKPGGRRIGVADRGELEIFLDTVMVAARCNIIAHHSTLSIITHPGLSQTNATNNYISIICRTTIYSIRFKIGIQPGAADESDVGDAYWVLHIS